MASRTDQGAARQAEDPPPPPHAVLRGNRHHPERRQRNDVHLLRPSRPDADTGLDAPSVRPMLGPRTAEPRAGESEPRAGRGSGQDSCAASAIVAVFTPPTVAADGRTREAPSRQRPAAESDRDETMPGNAVQRSQQDRDVGLNVGPGRCGTGSLELSIGYSQPRTSGETPIRRSPGSPIDTVFVGLSEVQTHADLARNAHLGGFALRRLACLQARPSCFIFESLLARKSIWPSLDRVTTECSGLPACSMRKRGSRMSFPPPIRSRSVFQLLP